jgi:hypothetical protein
MSAPAALLSLTLSHIPPLTHGPHCRLAPPVSRPRTGAATSRRPPMFARQRRCPCPSAGGRSLLPCAADRCAGSPLPSSPTPTRVPTPSPFSHCPVPVSPFSSQPRLSLKPPPPHFSTAYASASLALTTGDPSPYPVPVHFTMRLPIRHCGPQLMPPSPSLFHTDTARSRLHRHRPPELPPCRRTLLSRDFSIASTPYRCSGESPNSPLLAQHPPCVPHELTGSTLPPASHHQAIDEHSTAPSHARTARGDRAASALGARDLAARLRPSQPIGRPRVAGRHSLWTVVVARI